MFGSFTPGLEDKLAKFSSVLGPVPNTSSTGVVVSRFLLANASIENAAVDFVFSLVDFASSGTAFFANARLETLEGAQRLTRRRGFFNTCIMVVDVRSPLTPSPARRTLGQIRRGQVGDKREREKMQACSLLVSCG